MIRRPKLPYGHRFECLTTVDSTNAEALRRGAFGDRGPLWVMAERQTAGRGRGGRSWISRKGNLFASLLLTPKCPLGTASQLALVAGVAVWDCVAAAVGAEQARSALKPFSSDFTRTPSWPGVSRPSTSLQAGETTTVDARDKPGHDDSSGPEHALILKWPNDLLLGGAKLAGILLESTHLSAERYASIVIGIGLNLASHPNDLSRPTTDLAAAGCRQPPDKALERLAAAMANWLSRWDEGRGFEDVRTAWLDRAGPIGQPLRVQVNGHDAEGLFEGIDHSGALRLKTPNGERKIAAGDVFLL